MNRDRKILLIILLFSVLASFSIINLMILNDRNKRTRSSIDILEDRYVRLQNGASDISPQTLENMKSLLESEKIRFFQADETDPYKLGIDILAKLENRNIKVEQYKTLEQDNGFFLEFSVHSGAYSFFAFWEDLYREGKYYSIPYFSINNETDGISSNFRIGYAVYE